MSNMLKKGISLIFMGLYVIMANAQEDKGASLEISGDVVSSYVWRGGYNSGASVQPMLELNAAGFSFAVWGSKEISGPGKEMDLTAAYSLGSLGICISDYWWGGEKIGNENAESRNNKYFHFDNHNTAHTLEAGIDYTWSEKFPLNIAWYTLFWGADKKSNGKQNYSSYVELNYPFQMGRTELNATLGASVFESGFYEVKGFAVCNVALGASRDIKITKSFSLPLFANLIFDPAHEDAHLVLGFTLK